MVSNGFLTTSSCCIHTLMFKEKTDILRSVSSCWQELSLLYSKGKGIIIYQKCTKQERAMFRKEEFNSATNNYLYVETKEKDRFVFVLDKHKHKTRIHGGDYQDFLLNYNMDRGDRIKLDMNNKPPYLLIYPPDKYGNAKERVLEEFVFKDTARAIVYSKNFNPTASEIARMNIAAVNHGIGVGAVYVHTITKSDIAQNMMHIPKIITSLLKIPRSGKARLVMAENEVVTQAEYFKSTDGRLRFKKGWTEFAVKCKLGTGVRVLIMFDMVAKKLVVYFDVVRYWSPDTSLFDVV